MSMNKIRALLIDLDGTLYFKGRQIEGANRAISELRDMGYTLRFLTNTDSIHHHEVHTRVQALGLEVAPEEIFCPSVAVLNYFASRPTKSCYCLATDNLQKAFQDLPWDHENPDYVVVGDCRDKVSYPELNKVFRFLMQGAKLLATSRSRYFHTAEGMFLDTGCFVTLLEYASGQQAEVLGKPSPSYFSMALSGTGLHPAQAAVVGDDVLTDIAGALNFGAAGILVKTGKYSDAGLQHSAVTPDVTIDSIAYLPMLLKSLSSADKPAW